MGLKLVDPDPPMTSSSGQSLRTRITNMFLVQAVVTLILAVSIFSWNTAGRVNEQAAGHSQQWADTSFQLFTGVMADARPLERESTINRIAPLLLEHPLADSLTISDAQGRELFHGTGTLLAATTDEAVGSAVTLGPPVIVTQTIPADSEWNPGGSIRLTARSASVGWSSAALDPIALALFLAAVFLPMLVACRSMISLVCDRLVLFAKSLTERRLRSESAPLFEVELHKIGSVVQGLHNQLNDANKELKTLRTRMDSQVEKETKTLNVELRRAIKGATTDKLTGLFNRRFLEEQLPKALSEMRLAQQDLAVVAVDLDNFKALNDTKGHGAGDSVLSFAGQLIRSSLRDEDFAVRLGGDEFVVVLPDTNLEGAESFAQRLTKLFNQGSRTYSKGVDVSMSVGVASLLATGATECEQLLEAADRTLYRAKQSGRNCVVAFA
jgi:diguanylate cyclase (GGDEF)-like protein